MSARHTLHDATGILESIPGVGISKAAGNTVPTDGDAGYAKGCQFTRLDTGVLYLNNGSTTACKFETIPSGNATGAASIGIADAGSFITATTVEGALQELAQSAYSVQGGTIDIPLTSVREIIADGSYGNIVTNGGFLANDTTPNLTINANGAQVIGIATSNVDKFGFQFTLPPDVDPLGNITLTFGVKGGGTTNAFGVALTFSIDGATPVVAGAGSTGANLTTANAAFQLANGTLVAASNLSATTFTVSANCTPAAHATDGWFIYGIRVTYKKKLLTA